MKAVELEAIRKLVVIDADKPAINNPNEVLIKVSKVGVCGSEIHGFEGTHPYRKPPAVMGHEMLGTVVEIGSAVERVAVGTRATVDPQWVCGECEWCQSEDHNLCLKKLVMGTAAWPGALGEYIVVPDYSVFPVPDHLSPMQATMVEPVGVVVHAAHRANLQPGASVLILGGGSIGLLMSAMAKVRGAETIIVADIKQHCLDAAFKMGATHTLMVGKDSISETVMAATKARGVDFVFLTVGVPELFNDAFDAVRRRGMIVVIALYEGPVTFDPYRIIQKEVTIIGSLMSNDKDVHEAVELVASGQIEPQHIVTHQLPIDEAQHGFELAATKDDGAIKVVLSFD